MNENENPKKPDIIYVDAIDDEEVKKGYEEQRYWSSIRELKNAHFPFGLRILAVFVGSFAAVIAALVFVGAVVWFGISLIAFRQSPSFNAQADKAWKLTRKCTLIAFGSLLTIFNPALGIGLVILYFMINGEEVNSMILKRFSSYSPHQN